MALPEHPEEKRLRKAEQELATTLRKLTKKVTDALERHDREASFAGLVTLEATAQAAKNAMAQAIQDQMDLVAGKPSQEPDEGT